MYTYPAALFVTVCVLVAATILSCVVITVLFIFQRKSKVIRSSSLVFNLMTLSGVYGFHLESTHPSPLSFVPSIRIHCC